MANQGKFVLDNLTYDLITILHEKSKGLEAFDKYERDVQGNQEIQRIFQEIRRNDEQCVQQLEQQLGQILQKNQGVRKVA
jgi:hypothetical protein